ncbi:DUF6776 family protein [Cupriavidus basilensis]|uniref:DNA-binding protein n=1 Tax=Cupriavidus basilensis TaxID=68895 RepID=A0A643FRT5_9BURK|nr:DUF6776 family protein [Cupriavidus basilensis]QOT77035.1 DNA-binding protein [Cupriavidus basilensis]
MKYRVLRPRRGSLSGSLAVRSHLPWPLRVLGAAAVFVVVLVVVVVAAHWAYDAGRRLAGAPDRTAENKALREQVAAMTAQQERLQAVANTAEAQLQMARSAQEALAGQLKTAEGEVAQLKEDLAFFEGLLPASGNTSGIHVRSFRVGLDEADPLKMHYRLLIMQGGSKAFSSLPEFRGELQLVVSLLRDGKPVTLSLPENGAGLLPGLRVTHYQRIESAFALPAGATVRAVTVRILQNGQLRATQTAMP